jgi:hydroxymethylpyrimidine kinase/phosphomethylpyrimidine kinase
MSVLVPGRFPVRGLERILMRTDVSLPIALTIAGSDSGGGAGVQADLKTFLAFGVHGVSAITCLTAQNPRRMLAADPVGPGFVRLQLEAVFAELPPGAVKTGMLYSASIVRSVAEFLSRRRDLPLVVDPVMVSTSGRSLLKSAAYGVLTRRLLPLAVLVTPNLAEAQVLSGMRLGSVEDMREAARRIHARFGCGVLVKGGHLRRSLEAVDIYFDGKQELLLSAPFIRGVRTHGTGCTYSAAVTAGLARGWTQARAVRRAKEYISQAIAGSRTAAGHSVLEHRMNRS